MRAAWNHAHFFRHTRNVSNSKKAGKCENNSRNAYAHTHSVREREKKNSKKEAPLLVSNATDSLPPGPGWVLYLSTFRLNSQSLEKLPFSGD